MNWRMPSSSTWRSSTIDGADTRRLAWSRRSSMNYSKHHQRQHESSNSPPGNPGHTRASGKPGAVHSARCWAFRHRQPGECPLPDPTRHRAAEHADGSRRDSLSAPEASLIHVRTVLPSGTSHWRSSRSGAGCPAAWHDAPCSVVERRAGWRDPAASHRL